MWGLVFLRMLLANIGVTVLPTQKTIAFAANAFDANDALLNPTDQAAIVALGAELAETLARLKR
jgi:hypothetical protein